jgi:hypothetical protein
MENSLTKAIIAKNMLRQSIAWGFNDNEVLGYTKEKHIEVFEYALKTIEALEKDLINLKLKTNMPL